MYRPVDSIPGCDLEFRARAMHAAPQHCFILYIYIYIKTKTKKTCCYIIINLATLSKAAPSSMKSASQAILYKHAHKNAQIPFMKNIREWGRYTAHLTNSTNIRLIRLATSRIGLLRLLHNSTGMGERQ